MKHKFTIILGVLAFIFGCTSIKSPSRQDTLTDKKPHDMENNMIQKIEKKDKEWKESLTTAQFRILRKGDTENAFSGKYNDHYEDGFYFCAACGTPLFSSEAKYDHGSGWPSFTAAFDENNIEYHADYSLFKKRTEVRCAVCDSHLGHVFNDGPAPTHKHYCINSIALDFQQAKSPAPSAASSEENMTKSDKTEIATFAAGCFWGVEQKFREIKGVFSTRVGYSGGNVKNPTYKKVCSDSTGHAESVEITFDPSTVSYSELLAHFFRLHDPTQLNRQGPDVGTQYRSMIFYHNDNQKQAAQKMIENLQKSGRFRKSIVTRIVPAPEFYEAEEYHQQYYEKLKK